MSAKSIREYDGKAILSRWVKELSGGKHTLDTRRVLVSPTSSSGVAAAASQQQQQADLQQQEEQELSYVTLQERAKEVPWLTTERLVVKPDQLIKRRGKSGLIGLNYTLEEADAWINERMGKEVPVEHVKGVLDHFIVEPFLKHDGKDEYYLAIRSVRQGEEILFTTEGGVDVGDVDAKAKKLLVKVGDELEQAQVEELLSDVQAGDRKALLSSFLSTLFKVYTKLHFTYLEINPLVVVGEEVHVLDLAARLDQTAQIECTKLWGNIDFPPPFGRPILPEERYIQELDSKTGASLKLTVLNPKGRIWLMVAGGGASVVYTDSLSDLAPEVGKEVANYGEYSGDPTEAMTFEYAKTILSLMTSGPVHPLGKVLIIGGGIANFTDVAETFKGIVRAIGDFQEKLRNHKVRIYVRRGGPNYAEGLRLIKEKVEVMEIPIWVYGPETHITAIVNMALEDEEEIKNKPMSPPARRLERGPLNTSWATKMQNSALRGESSSDDYQRQMFPAADPLINPSQTLTRTLSSSKGADLKGKSKTSVPEERQPYTLFTKSTTAIVYGMQLQAVQSMLDFDHLCERETPSVKCIIYPFAGTHYRKFFWGQKEIMLPVVPDIASAFKRFPNDPSLDTMVNFASCRSVYESTIEALSHPEIKVIAIIAEGVPERHTRLLIEKAKNRPADKGGPVTIIGPATVGGIKPGCFRIGNTGGMLDNVLSSKLYRPGSVAYVSRSGGLSNELNNIISRTTNGVYEGIAIGGDRYPGTTFMDHLLRFQDDPQCKMMVLLGEVGGIEEYQVCQAIKEGRITKPVVAWCTGTCAKMFPTEVQFGHAGAFANDNLETADAKNVALKQAGAHVPSSFTTLPELIRKVYLALVESGEIVEEEERPAPRIPIDYTWARKLGMVRKPASFVSTITDERGEELMYAGMPISQVFEEDIGIGGVLSLLWFRRRLPNYACKFIEMVLMMTADHGPAVAGAHNTIVTARAGRDLISSLASGLLTIGPRFGGAVDGAAKLFSWGHDTGLSPQDFVDTMRKKKELIMGIGHRIKSLHNPDKRVTILKEYAFQHFPNTSVLKYALAVEQITTQKKANLILNVDGCMGCAFVDLLRHCGAFTPEEVDDLLKNDFLNGLFVLGRSIGFIGHYLDQKRLQEGLYRHPTDDIFYMTNPDTYPQ
ncbi:ATP citrate synthase [Balamuthia mandrillaris]